MSETEQTKICPLCAEAVKATAKVCPHCRHWQKRWSLQNPQVGVTLWTSLALAVWCCFGLFAGRMFGPKEQFADYRHEIGVVNSQFSQRLSGSNLWLSVVGTLTNHSGIGWKDVAVEAQFFDESGKLIDAITVNANDYHGVVILPHGVAAFKIEGRASHPAADYSTNKLDVQWAKDVDQLF